MEESRKVYGWLVRGGFAAAGCSSMWAWRGVASSKQWKLGLFSTIYSPEVVKIDNFKAGFFAFDKFVTTC